jgi:hypothetical protein
VLVLDTSSKAAMMRSSNGVSSLMMCIYCLPNNA